MSVTCVNENASQGPVCAVPVCRLNEIYESLKMEKRKGSSLFGQAIFV